MPPVAPSSSSSSDEEDVSNLLECSICMDLCQIPIQQCRNGHNICASHLDQMTDIRCPNCRVQYFGIMRNLVAEKLVAKKRKALEKERNNMRRPTISRPLRQSATIRCRNSTDGCGFDAVQNSAVQQHEERCNFRPIECCLKTDGCAKSEIPFADYMNHLKTTHNVKSVVLDGPTYIHKYFINPSRPKLVRDGSSSLFIMEAVGESFLVTAKLRDEKVYVVVAIHTNYNGDPKYRTTIRFIPKNPGIFQFQEDGEFRVCGLVWTTRDHHFPNDILSKAPHNFGVPIPSVQSNLEQLSPTRGKFAKKYWSVKITIGQTRLPGIEARFDNSIRNSSNAAGSSPQIMEIQTRPRQPVRRSPSPVETGVHSISTSQFGSQNTIRASAGPISTSLRRVFADSRPSGSTLEDFGGRYHMHIPSRPAMSEFAREFYRAGDGSSNSRLLHPDDGEESARVVLPRTAQSQVPRSTNSNAFSTRDEMESATFSEFAVRQFPTPGNASNSSCCIQ